MCPPRLGSSPTRASPGARPCYGSWRPMGSPDTEGMVGQPQQCLAGDPGLLGGPVELVQPCGQPGDLLPRRLSSPPVMRCARPRRWCRSAGAVSPWSSPSTSGYSSTRTHPVSLRWPSLGGRHLLRPHVLRGHAPGRGHSPEEEPVPSARERMGAAESQGRCGDRRQGWTDDGAAHEVHSLKRRAAKATRPVPTPPVFVHMLREYIERFGVAADGRMFHNAAGNYVDASAYNITWGRAHEPALTLEEEYREQSRIWSHYPNVRPGGRLAGICPGQAPFFGA